MKNFKLIISILSGAAIGLLFIGTVENVFNWHEFIACFAFFVAAFFAVVTFEG